MKTLLKIFLILFSLSLAGACGETCTPGPVKEDCVCAYILKPVCGCDGQTYSNECLADCEGITSWTEGECDE